MRSHTFSLSRVLPSLAFVLLPFAAACFEDRVVGEDPTPDAATSDAQACPATVECNEPNVPTGCHLGAGSCVNGKYECPAVVCPAEDAGTSCSSAGVACEVPPIPSGCTIGPASCDHGVYVCPAVVCPTEDAGACPGVNDCNEPVVPPGCTLGAGSCDHGTYICPAVVCPVDAGSAVDAASGFDSGSAVDGGSPGDASVCVDINLAKYDTNCTQASDCIAVVSGEVCSSDCLCPTAAANSSEQSRYNAAIASLHSQAECACPDYGEPSCIQGKCQLCVGTGTNPPYDCTGSVDAGSVSTGFACGPADALTCDAATQYCSITQGGPMLPDGGTPTSVSCKAIPSSCASDRAGAAATCACIGDQVHGNCVVSDGSDYTVTIDVP